MRGYHVGQATLKDGRFILRGQYGRAGKGVLTTNNLELIGQNASGARAALVPLAEPGPEH